MSYTTEDWVIKEYLPNTEANLDLTWNDVLELRKQKVVKVNPMGVNRRYIDPPVEGQNLGLLSFIPAQGATPNQKGFYGYVKLRGNYATEKEVILRENEIIHKIDASNHVFTCHVGHPVPLVVEGYAKVKNPIDVKKVTEQDMNQNIKAKAEETKAQIKEIKDVEQKLRREVEEGPDPLDTYTASRNKLAIHRWMLKEHERKIQEIQGHRDRCIVDLIKTLENHPEYEDLHLKRYLEIRAQKGFHDEEVAAGDFTSMSFIKHPIIWDEEKVDLSEVDHIIPKVKSRLTRIQDETMLRNIFKEEKYTLVRFMNEPQESTCQDHIDNLKVVEVLDMDLAQKFMDSTEPPCVALFEEGKVVLVEPLSDDLSKVKEYLKKVD